MYIRVYVVWCVCVCFMSVCECIYLYVQYWGMCVVGEVCGTDTTVRDGGRSNPSSAPCYSGCEPTSWACVIPPNLECRLPLVTCF